MKPVPPTFRSKLPRLTIYQLEHLTPRQAQRREALEELEAADWLAQQPRPARRP
jgi:hypothetical protein